MINFFDEKWLENLLKAIIIKVLQRNIFKKIAILNFKYGTGKIRTAVNLSYTLYLKDYKVLIISTINVC